MLQGAITLLAIVHGPNSVQVKSLVKDAGQIRAKYAPIGVSDFLGQVAKGVLSNLKAELDAGVVGSLQRGITGEVITDFVKLARTAMEEKEEQAKNVAAVLAASVYEHTMRRLALTNGLPHAEKLADCPQRQRHIAGFTSGHRSILLEFP